MAQLPRTDNFRADQGNLFQEKWLAGVDFLRFGITIVGWATLDHIGDVDIPRDKPADWSNSLSNWPGGTDKRLSFLVFVISRCFSDKHHRRLWVAHAEDDLAPSEFGERGTAGNRAVIPQVL